MSSLISIVVPVYNASATIVRCIKSVLSQTYTNFELIIIDDGSTDDSLVICEKFAVSDSRIIVRHQENAGVSAARNLGITLCAGEWISFLDSDDYLDAHYLEDLITDSSDCDLIIGGYKKKYLNTNQVVEGIQFPNKYLGKDDDCMSLWDKILYCGEVWGKLYKSTIIKQYRLTFPVEYSLAEDHIFYYKFLTLISRIKLSDKNNYFYVNNGTATLSRNTMVDPDLKWNAYLQISDILQDIIVNFKLKNDCLPLTQNANIRLYTSAIIDCYRRKFFNSTYIYPSKELRGTIRNFYKPKSLRGYVIKSILLYLPTSVQHFILKSLIR